MTENPDSLSSMQLLDGTILLFDAADRDFELHPQDDAA